MRSALAGRQRRVPLVFALLIAVLAGLFTFTVERGPAHAADTLGHEAIHLHILAMADLLSSGIMRQFPNRFS